MSLSSPQADRSKPYLRSVHRKEALHKMAPGYNPSVGVLVPTSISLGGTVGAGKQISQTSGEQRAGSVDLMGEGVRGLGLETMGPQVVQSGDIMDDLVSGLEAMESRR